jgi:hypothetical protein
MFSVTEAGYLQQFFLVQIAGSYAIGC